MMWLAESIEFDKRGMVVTSELTPTPPSYFLPWCQRARCAHCATAPVIRKVVNTRPAQIADLGRSGPTLTDGERMMASSEAACCHRRMLRGTSNDRESPSVGLAESIGC